jgi:hypothetical protein
MCSTPDGQLSSEHRRSEGVGGIEQNEIGLRIQVEVQVDIRRRGDPANLNFSCRRHSARSPYRSVIIHLGYGPAGYGGRCGEAAETPGQPVRYSSLVGIYRAGQRPERQCDEANASVQEPGTCLSFGNRVPHIPSQVLSRRFDLSPRLRAMKKRACGSIARCCCSKAARTSFARRRPKIDADPPGNASASADSINRTTTIHGSSRGDHARNGPSHEPNSGSYDAAGGIANVLAVDDGAGRFTARENETSDY